jgi:hypothetical protein
MSSRSERLTALEAGPLGGGDPLLLVQRYLAWKRRVKWAFLSFAALILLCASLLIGYEIGILLFSLVR